MKPPRPVLETAAALLLVPLLAGCSTFLHRTRVPDSGAVPPAFMPAPVAVQPPLDPSLLQKPAEPYRLGPGDQLEIEVLGDVDTDTLTTVGPDGKIYFYLLPGLDVWGLTVAQVRDRIVTGLQKFIREKQPVSVTLRKAASQQYWILGRLNKPGEYPLTGPTTLIEAVAVAGGLSPKSAFPGLAGPVAAASGGGFGGNDDAADLSRAFVIRQGRMLPVDFTKLLRDGDLSQNIYLQPDDFIYLPSATTAAVHVLGAVMYPRAVVSGGQMTLMRAVSDAGGTIQDAYLSHVTIVRGSLTEPKVAIINLRAIELGQASDVALEPQDIVYVPFTPYRVLRRYLDMILDTFVRTVGVNEGAYAITRSAIPVGVNVPVGPVAPP